MSTRVRSLRKKCYIVWNKALGHFLDSSTLKSCIEFLFSFIINCMLEQLHIGLAFESKAQAHFCIG